LKNSNTFLNTNIDPEYSALLIEQPSCRWTPTAMFVQHHSCLLLPAWMYAAWIYCIDPMVHTNAQTAYSSTFSNLFIRVFSF
jgi:hypothetical protein